MRLNPSTVIVSAMPGNADIHHASRTKCCADPSRAPQLIAVRIAEAKEADAGFGQNGAACLVRHLRRNDRERHGRNVTHQDDGVMCTGRPRRCHEVAADGRHHPGAEHSCHCGPRREANDERHETDVAAEEIHDHHDEEEAWQGLYELGASHEHVIDDAAADPG